jgi:hypothetical protein
MKQIILEDSETRLNTLRHVFGIDKYKRILENFSILRLDIREEKKLMEGITINLDKERKLLDKKNFEIEEKKKILFNLTESLLMKIEKRKNKEAEKEQISKLIEGKAELKEKLGQANDFYIQS